MSLPECDSTSRVATAAAALRELDQEPVSGDLYQSSQPLGDDDEVEERSIIVDQVNSNTYTFLFWSDDIQGFFLSVIPDCIIDSLDRKCLENIHGYYYDVDEVIPDDRKPFVAGVQSSWRTIQSYLESGGKWHNVRRYPCSPHTQVLEQRLVPSHLVFTGFHIPTMLRSRKRPRSSELSAFFSPSSISEASEEESSYEPQANKQKTDTVEDASSSSGSCSSSSSSANGDAQEARGNGVSGLTIRTSGPVYSSDLSEEEDQEE